VRKLTAICALLVCAGFVAGAPAGAADPTAREQAAAIDKVAIPPGESADLEHLAGGLRRPWCIAFVPGGDLLITEKYFGVRMLRDGVLQANVLAGGPPGVFAKEDSGVLDVAPDPDFATNRMVYVSFAEGAAKANRTAVWKAHYDGARLSEGRVIFRAAPDKADSSHPGGRILFLPDKTFLLTVGDGFAYKAAAQDLSSHLGKILRLTRDGAAPPDNPFVGRAGALPEIWSYGHRNPQGLALDPETGVIWQHEHGPRGGDEINVLRAGANYGWPIVTHGIDYDGKIISDRAFAPGVEPSAFFWAPSIAPSGLAIYRGPFADWRGKLFVGALAAKTLVRLRKGKETGLLVEEERMFASLKKRIRDVRQGPDGMLYVLTDEQDGELLRLRPKAP
jgi:glucose/arabinose dehydrogenase